MVTAAIHAEQPPDFTSQIAPLLTKYCAGCHNTDDREGGLALDSYAEMRKGGENGAVLTPGSATASRIYRSLTGKSEPAMPPEDEAQPKPEEISLIGAWIDAGAAGPDGLADPTILITPTIRPTADVRPSVNAVAVSPGGDVAMARYGVVTLSRIDGEIAPRKLAGHRGNVNSVSFSAGGKTLVAACGEAGLFGEVRLWNVADGKLITALVGHRDSLYSAALSPNSKLLATGSYDRTVKIWDVASGKVQRTLSGHNGAVYALAFHPSGNILASASGDRTVKLWDVETGSRLDTFGQSTKELYALAFHPNGERLAAGGVDNRIRVWQISATGKEGTNRLRYSRFAHESPILQLAYSADGRTLVSSGEDRLVKTWHARRMTLRSTITEQSDWVTGLAVTGDNQRLIVGRLDGSTHTYELAKLEVEAESAAQPLTEKTPAAGAKEPAVAKLPKTPEVEPNDAVDQATPLVAPAIASGVIHSGVDKQSDVDLFRFAAKAGEAWVIETNAARSKSPLDTKIEVLHEDGRPVQRLLLRAVRDSEITFRGINSEQLNCRVVNWEEMKLNQFLYIDGEVVKLYRAPRGPDSGFQFYPNTGKRFCYFDTSARAYPLGQPCYIVEPYTAGSQLPDNGLPTFPVFYENDDDSLRKLGKDSRLTFTAPADGQYLVRVRDVRGLDGEDFKYELTVRRPQPDFKVTLSGANPTINAGSGKNFSVRADRIDGFDGPIRIDITGVPPGYSVSSPIVIQAGHIEAHGVVSAHTDAPQPNEANWSKTKVTATAKIGGRNVMHKINNLGTVKLAAQPKLLAYLELNDGTTLWPDKSAKDAPVEFPGVPELTIEPGSSVTCKLRVERNGFAGRIQFDVHNLPHGVIVDDIGLSGVLIPAGQTERTIFLRASDWVPETSRPFFAVAKVAGNQATLPMILHVRATDDVASRDE